MKKLILRYLLFAGFCFMIGFSYTYHLPNFKIWSIDQIEKLSQKYLPVQIMASNLDFQIFPLGINLKNIRITPKEELSKAISTSYIDEFEISLNPFSFLTGFFEFSKVVIRRPQVRILNLKEFEKLQTKKSDTPFDLKEILSYPLDSFQILNLNLTIEPHNEIPSIVAKNLSLEIENQKTSALLSAIGQSIQVYDPQLAEIPAEASFGGRLLIQENQILLSALKIKKGDSYIIASGYSESPINKINADKLNLKITTSLKLHQLRTELIPFFKTKNIPQVYGELESQTYINKNSQEPIQIDSKFYFKDLQINQFYVGEFVGQTVYKNNLIHSPILEVKNQMGSLVLKNTNLQLTDPFDYNTQITVNNVQIKELLKNLGLGELPLTITANSQIPCSGNLKGPKFLKCQGDLSLSNLRVYNEDTEFTIVDIKKGTLKGSVEVTDKRVNTSAEITIGEHTKGKASGYVDYNDGFYYDYETPSINFEDVNLANLELLGTASLKGSTKGDSDQAIFNIDTNTNNFLIKDYFLGDFDTKINYKSGILYFKKIDGLIRTTKYVGDLNVNLNKSTIAANINSPYIELYDLQRVFERIVKIPVEIYGGGRAEVSLSGPLEFNLLSYKLNSEFINGTIANESYDKLTFDVTSKNGHVKTDNATLKKGSGTLTLTGTALPNGKIDTLWTGENFSLQNINLFANSNLNMDGILNFTLKLTEHILSPNSDLKGKVTNTTISQEPVADTSFNLKFEKQGISGNGEIFGDQIKTNFLLPYTEDAPFKLDAQIKNWDFVPLIHLISSRSRALEFKTLLSGNINLQSSKNSFWNSSGTIDLTQLQVQRGMKEFFAPEPISLTLDQGNLHVNSFFLRGDNTSLELNTFKIPNYPLSFGVNGKIDLGLLSFLTPFFNDLRGTLALSSQIGFSQDDWKMTGSAFISDGYFRVDKFPHPVEDIETDLIFNNNLISVNKFIARFAGGNISGDGNIELIGVTHIPVNLDARATNIQLKVPQDVTTKGSGDFKIKGNYFPYFLEGTYIVDSGLMTKSFENTDTSISSYARSQLLPKSLVKKTDELIILDVDTVFTKGFDIRNDLLDARIFGKLKIKGPPSSTIFLGPVQIQKDSQIFFKETPFYVEIGEIRFNSTTKLNGDIYISANAEVEESRDNRIQKYDINMLIQGRMDNYRINLSSNPARSEKDIASLLALGVTTESTQSQLSQEQVQKQSYEVGASILTKNKFGRELKYQTGLDFKVSSAIDQRSKSTAPKVTISKQWSPKLGTSASRTFGETGTNDLKVQYQLNKNMSVIGSWEARETTNANTQIESKEKDATDILGLDLEYKFEFK